LERSSSKNISGLKCHNRNYIPASSGNIVDVLRKSQKDVSMRMGANGIIDLQKGAGLSNSDTSAFLKKASFQKDPATLHGRLMDIKE
jgi:hypothetical protein